MKRGTLLLGIVSLALLVALAPVPAFSQATNGEITGRVLDSAGAVVPGASVIARNDATGLTRQVTTTSEGDYLIVQLPPGTYTVSAELVGFRKAVRKAVPVNVGTRVTLGFDLAVGNVSESVEVSAAGSLVETTRSDISGVVTPKEIESLPLIDRTFAGMAVIMPEARPTGNFDPTKTRLGTFAMNGGDGRQLDVNVDGGDNKDNAVGGLIQNFAYESIQEFQVLQHRWSAESGRAVGGVVNVITKSGTNDFRFTAFGTYRSQDTRAKNYFEEQPGGTKAAFERWEYGGSFGGPVVKDKLFFFGALERFDEPSTETQVRANAIPQLQAIPWAEPVSAIPSPYDDTLGTFKLDYHPGANHSLAARFAYQDLSTLNDQITAPATTDLTGGSTNTIKNYDFVASHTWTLGTAKLNQFTFHFQDFKNEILGVTDDPIQIFPSVRTGPAPNTPQQTTERKFQFRDDFSWQTGKHAFKVGANYIHTKLGGYFYFGAFGYQLTWFDDPVTIATNTARYPQGFSTPGAVRLLDYFTGEASHDQEFHQLAFYAQDDFRVSRKLTLNLGLRWDANIGLLTDQTTNRTMDVLRQLDDPRAQAIAGDAEKLGRSTPSWKEFQPRIGFAYDIAGDGRTVVRGGYGIFYDQIFQNLTVFSLSQSGPEYYAQTLAFTNTNVGVGQLPNFRYGVDPLPTPPPPSFGALPRGTFGRITDPDARDPYVQKFSIGFQRALGSNWVLSSDYVHTLGLHEPRVLVVNPQIRPVCDPTFPGSTPTSPRCVAGATTRYFDQAFVAAGMGVNRLGQINMISTTNRSLFDSWTTTLRGRTGRVSGSLSYVLASSRSWGGQPTASYSGNGVGVIPEQQFAEGEFGPTRNDERHRVVGSAVIDLPLGFQVAPVVQFSTARPYTPTTGYDINGDGLTNSLDRICDGASLDAVFAARGNATAIRALLPNGCTPEGPGSQRSGRVVNPDGSVEERSGRFFNADLRVTKTFGISARARLKVYADLYNLFNTENLAFNLRTPRTDESQAVAATFLQPLALWGPGFGPPVAKPFTASFGARIEF